MAGGLGVGTQTSSGSEQDVDLQKVGGTAITLGQKTMAASIPVVVASDQTAFSVNATLAAETTKVIGTVNIASSQTIAVTNAGTFATQATLQTGSNVVGAVTQSGTWTVQPGNTDNTTAW